MWARNFVSHVDAEINGEGICSRYLFRMTYLTMIFSFLLRFSWVTSLTINACYTNEDLKRMADKSLMIDDFDLSLDVVFVVIVN